MRTTLGPDALLWLELEQLLNDVTEVLRGIIGLLRGEDDLLDSLLGLVVCEGHRTG